MDDGQTPAVATGGAGGRARIDFATRLAVLRLVQESPQLSNVAIGDMLGISHQSVMRLRSTVAGDIKQLTQTVLQTEIAPSIEDWVTARTLAADRGDHRPARDMLIAAQPAPSWAVWRREYRLRRNKKPGAWPGSLRHCSDRAEAIRSRSTTRTRFPHAALCNQLLE